MLTGCVWCLRWLFGRRHLFCISTSFGVQAQRVSLDGQLHLLFQLTPILVISLNKPLQVYISHSTRLALILVLFRIKYGYNYSPGENGPSFSLPSLAYMPYLDKIVGRHAQYNFQDLKTGLATEIEMRSFQALSCLCGKWQKKRLSVSQGCLIILANVLPLELMCN